MRLRIFHTAAICRGSVVERAVTAVFPPDGKLTYAERADLRRYENGKYVGLESWEVKGTLQ
jgi:hypothetical protein